MRIEIWIPYRQIQQRHAQFDKLSNQLWVTVEEQALYIKELNERMKLLQEHLIEKKLQELE